MEVFKRIVEECKSVVSEKIRLYLGLCARKPELFVRLFEIYAEHRENTPKSGYTAFTSCVEGDMPDLLRALSQELKGKHEVVKVLNDAVKVGGGGLKVDLGMLPHPVQEGRPLRWWMS